MKQRGDKRAEDRRAFVVVAAGLCYGRPTMLAERIQPDPTRETDCAFMLQALVLARQAATCGEVPIGALLVRDGRIVGTGHNAPIALSDPTAHAEVLALREAARAERNYRLPGTTLYATVEPCAMCVGALLQARVTRVVFGCADPRAGALGSVCDLSTVRTNHRLAITGGVCADPARALMQEIFRVRRGA